MIILSFQLIFLAKFCWMLVGVFFDIVKIRGKNQEVGSYYRDNSPASSSKYQHNRNLLHCINLIQRDIHQLIRLVLNYKRAYYDTVMDSLIVDHKLSLRKSGLYRVLCMIMLQYHSFSKDFNDPLIKNTNFWTVFYPLYE